jgi:lipopolysaccharide/colanic/teichoic acid biosynthesis glycosyltransferase
VEFAGGYVFAQSTPEPLDNPANRSAKRLLDLLVALPVVMLILPLVVLVTAVMQGLQAPGPVLYSQWRTGFNRRRFRIYKLRTMYVANPNTALQATRGDSRIFPFGRFLRRTSLDELPQFLNVFSGEMSVSGPRPHLMEHDELFAQRIRTYRKRHLVKPGITGLAQMKGYRGEITQPSDILRRVRYDMHYVARWSLWLDVRIIVGTIRQIFFPPQSAI